MDKGFGMTAASGLTIAGIAVDLAKEVLKFAAGRGWQELKGSAEERALQQVWQSGLRRMLEQLAPRLGERQDYLQDIAFFLREYLAEGDTAGRLFELVIPYTPDEPLVPALDELHRRFYRLEEGLAREQFFYNN